MARFRLIKRLLRFVLALALVLCFAFAALVAWVATGPRSLDAFTSYMENAVSNASPHYKVKIKNALLVSDGWAHPVGIRFLDVSVTDEHGVSLAHFPEVGVGFYVLDMLRGEINLKAIELLNPAVNLAQDAQGHITSFGLSDNQDDGKEASLSPALDFLASSNADGPLARLESFTIRHAGLSMINSQGKAFLSSTDGFIQIIRRPGKAEGKLEMPLRFDGRQARIAVHFTLDGAKKTVHSRIAFERVPSSVLHALAPSQPWIGGISMPLSGHADSISDFQANIDSLDFDLSAGHGTVDLPDQFERPLTVEHIAVDGSLRDRLTQFAIKKGLIDFGSVKLNFKGEGRKVGEAYGVDAYVQAAHAPVDDIHLYWPLKLAPHSRHWVTTHIAKGTMEKAYANLHFKPGEFKLKDTPDAAIETSITVKGATITYKPKNPPITDIDGTVRFTGRTMDAQVTNARYLNDTHIAKARLRFPDFYPDDVRLFAELELDSTAQDVRRFLSLPDIDKAKKLNLTDEIAGKASGSAKLDFIAFSENGKDDVGETGKLNYAVNAALIDAVQPKFLGKYDISHANVILAVDNKGVKVAGKTDVNGLPMHIDLASAFAGSNKTTYSIQTTMPIERLPDFGLPKLDFASGSMEVNADLYSSDDKDKATATLDLTRTGITLVKQGLVKKAGEKASLSLSTETLASGNTLIPSFAFGGDGYKVAGTAEFDKGLHDFIRFSLSPVKLNKTDLDSLDFQQQGKSLSLKAEGRVFDVSAYVADNSQSGDLGYDLDVKTEKLLLGEGRGLNNVSLIADCPAAACRSVDLRAVLNGGAAFDYRIGDGKLLAATSNAGELAHALGIFPTMEGGDMKLNGNYDQGQLKGLLEVKGYRIRKAPIMTKIFTMASLSGMLNTLMGKGIYFEKLTAPFIFERGILILKDAKAHGAALGLTADGMIDTGKSTLDLQGVLVPSYTLNSLVGNIPLLGNLLMGGSGKGLVALSYGIHGDMKDPTVRVNPLSVLTPGFLRDIFTIFDKPPPNLDALLAKQKESGNHALPADMSPVSGDRTPAK